MRLRCALQDNSEGRTELNDEFLPMWWVIWIDIITVDEINNKYKNMLDPTHA